MRVGMVVNRLEDYALPLVAGLSEELGRNDASLLVVIHSSTRAGEEPWVRRLVRAGVVDALVVTSVIDPPSGRSLVDELVEQASGVPVVTLGLAGHGVPDVNCDNAAAAAAVARHLLASGRRRPLLVAGPAHNAASTERETAFLAELTRAGVPGDGVHLVRGDFSREVAYRRTLEHLVTVAAEGEGGIDSVFAANDEMALGVLDSLAVRGLRCPEDVAVVGFDDTDAAAVARPALSSVDQQLDEQGRQAARVVLALLSGREVPDDVRTTPRLVARTSSTARPAEGAVSPEEVALLRAGAAELRTTRQLLALHHGLLNAVDETEMSREMTALLPRTGTRRALFARTVGGRAQLLVAWGAGVPGPVGTDPYPPERLLPPSHRDELDRGVLVVHRLEHGSEELGLLLYEQEVLERWTGQALQQGLSGALAAMSRTRSLTEHAEELERLVESRTAQLRTEVDNRRAAQEMLQQANGHLRRALLLDGLTGVHNRTAFDDALARAWEEAAATGEPLSVLMCDVDLFKRYNDAAGHLAGDACLRAVAAAVSHAVRGRDDVVARFGGEEFAVVLPRTDAAGARAVAGRVLHEVRATALPHPGCEPGTTVSLSIGAATSGAPARLRDAEELVAVADRALYAAKAAGRDRVQHADRAVHVPAPRRRPADAVPPRPVRPRAW